MADQLRNYLSGPDHRGRRLMAVGLTVALAAGGAADVATAFVNHSPAAAEGILAPAPISPSAPAAAPATTTTTVAVPEEQPSSTIVETTTPPSTLPPSTSTTTTVAARPAVHTAAASAPATSAADSCSTALAYLKAHAAPGFHFECPGYALGHQAMTCIDEPGVCPGTKLIAISDVCPASYMNEAHNSWVLSGLATGRIDPYGYCP